jgi:hypothetical protein
LKSSFWAKKNSVKEKSPSAVKQTDIYIIIFQAKKRSGFNDMITIFGDLDQFSSKKQRFIENQCYGPIFEKLNSILDRKRAIASPNVW